jgi:hypothetical protein
VDARCLVSGRWVVSGDTWVRVLHSNALAGAQTFGYLEDQTHLAIMSVVTCILAFIHQP